MLKVTQLNSEEVFFLLEELSFMMKSFIKLNICSLTGTGERGKSV